MTATRDETKSRIQQAAVELFSRNGYDGTSVREVVRAAGVTQPMLYYYFQNKEGLCRAILEDGHQRFQQFSSDALLAKGSPVERLARLVGVHFEMAHRERDLVRFFYGMLLGLGGRPAGIDVAAIRNDIVGRSRQEIERFAEEGIIPADRAEHVLMVVLGLINGHLLSWLDGWRELPDQTELRQTVELVWSGIGRMQ